MAGVSRVLCPKNTTRTFHAYDMSKIGTVEAVQTGRQADSLDLIPSLDVSA